MLAGYRQGRPLGTGPPARMEPGHDAVAVDRPLTPSAGPVRLGEAKSHGEMSSSCCAASSSQRPPCGTSFLMAVLQWSVGRGTPKVLAHSYRKIGQAPPFR